MSNQENKWVQPLDLVSPYRFDIMFKYMFADLMEKGITEDWALEPYRHHLEVWNNLTEVSPAKSGIEDYISSFKEIIQSFKSDGWNENLEPIPVHCSTKAPLNGAHRIAAALLFDKTLLCKEVDDNAARHVGCHCNASFLLSRKQHVATGLSRDHADLATLQYAKLKTNTRILTVFPAAVGHEVELNHIINNECHIIYGKKVNLSVLGAFNFIRYTYDEDKSRGNPWLGNANDGWSGARSKMQHCFPIQSKGIIRSLWFEEKSPQHSTYLKEKIRAIFNIGKHSVHINDTHTETLAMSGYLLNANGINFINQPDGAAPTPKFDSFFERFKLWISKSDLDINDFCIDSSAVLSAYGLRDCRDLDFLYAGSAIDTGMDDVSCHNEELKFYRHSKNEIIFNPQNHFYYKGVKFASLEVVKAMKQFRDEEKDKVDVRLIDNMVKNKETS